MFLTYLFARNKYVIFTVILLTLSLFGGIYLVQQRHNLQELATGGGTWTRCGRQSGGTYQEFNSTPHGAYQQTHWFDSRNPSEPDIKKPWYLGSVDLQWQSIFRCDYQKLMEKDGNVRECTTGDEDTWPSSNKPHHETKALHTSPQGGTEKGYSPNLGELIDWDHYDGQCQVIQVDVDGCPGGVVFTVYANDVCPTPTPTPTPTPPINTVTPTNTPTPPINTVTPTNTPTPPINTVTPTNTPTSTPTPTGTLTPTLTPTPTLPTDIYCLYCHAYDKDWQQITNLDNLTIGEEIYFATMGSGQTTKGRFRVTVDDESGDWHESTQQNDSDEFYLLHTVQQFGIHHVKCEVYDPSSGWK